VTGVAGEPNEVEREIGMAVVRAAEHIASKESSLWDELVELEVAQAFFFEAQRLSREQWGTMRRGKAERYLELCRVEIEPSDPAFELTRWAPRSEDLEEVLATLPEEDLKLVRLRLAGMDWEQCGQSLGIEPTAARMQWYRALRKLGGMSASNTFGQADG
jgi:hypothetical protein